MPTWLETNAWAVWLGLALVLGVVEAATVDLVFLMLAGGALAASLAALFGLGAVGQVVVAVAVAAALLGVVRPLAKSRLLGDAGSDLMGTDRYLQRLAVVTEEVTERSGLASIDGDVWSARVAPGESALPTGSEGRIEAVRGATLLLAPAAPIRDIIPRGEDS